MKSLKATCTYYSEDLGYRYCFNGLALLEVAGAESDIAWRGIVPEKLAKATRAVRIRDISIYSDLKEWLR